MFVMMKPSLDKRKGFSDIFAYVLFFVTEVMIGFEQTTYSVNEGNVVEVCTVLTGTLNRSLEVFVKSSGGSATGMHQVLWCNYKCKLVTY